MKYLCRHHQLVMQSDEENAEDLWRSAMEQGAEAFNLTNWRLAQSFFGSAFEIAIIRLGVAEGGEHSHLGQRQGRVTRFEAHHLTDAARRLATVLCHVDQFDEAEQALLYVHNFLLGRLNEQRSTFDGKKNQLRLIEEFLRRATSLLRIRGKSAYADTVNLLSNKVTASVRRQSLH